MTVSRLQVCIHSLWLGAALFAIPATADAQTTPKFNPKVWYRLTTVFRGPNLALDVYNGGTLNNQLHLNTKASYSGQYWKIRPFGSSAPGYFRFSTLFRGDNMAMDIFNGGPSNNEPHLATAANYTGQAWKITLIKGTKDCYRLTTLFRGPNMALDIFNGGSKNNRPHLAPVANYTGQYWKLTPISSVTPPASTSFGTGCSGKNGVHSLSFGLPYAGETLKGSLSNVPSTAFSRFAFGPRLTTPINLSVLGSSGCSVYVPLTILAAGTPSGTSHTIAIPIPRDPSLVCLKVAVQGFSVNPAATPRFLTSSNGRELVIGMR